MTTTKRPVGDVVWHLPPVNGGQIVEIAYGTDDEGGRWERTYDRSDRTTTYRHLGHASDGGVWEPWNEVPQAAR